MKEGSFIKIPTSLAVDSNISPAAMRAYAVVKHLAWKAGRVEEEDAVPLPPLSRIAPLVGCSETTLKTYLTELRGAGWLRTLRARRDRPQLYVVYDARRESDSDSRDGPVVSQIPTHSARASKGVRTKTASRAENALDSRTTTPDPDVMPIHVKTEGRDIVVDAIAAVCGIRPESPRYKQCWIYLHGRGPKQPGIREVFWRYLCRWATEHGRQAQLAELYDHPERFAEALEKAVHRRAEQYRTAMPNVTLSPKSLCEWFVDELPARRDQGLTPEEIAAYDRRSA